MSGVAIAVLVVIALPALLFGLYQVFQEARVRVDSGTVGLLIVRGQATERVLEPGLHLVLPYRKQMIQGYPLREMTYLAVAPGCADEADHSDPPLRAHLGDRAPVVVSYSIRFKIRPDGLPTIHERVGLDGIKRLVRDESRRVLIAELGSKRFGLDDAFGEGRERLAAAIALQLTEALRADGFEMVLFNLLDVDLGSVGEVVDATLRAKAEVELEKAAAQVRKLRAKNDASTEQLLASLNDSVLRYRQLELGREALQRWDGRSGVAESFVTRFVFPPQPPAGPGGDPPPEAQPLEEATEGPPPTGDQS